MKRSDFAIVGGGIAGLTAAITLERLGIDYRLYESAPELKGIGAGVGLAANAMHAFEYMGLREEIEQLGHHLPSFNLWDEKGEILLKPDTQKIAQTFKQENFVIHRADLHAFLLSKIESSRISLGSRATRFSMENKRVQIGFERQHAAECEKLIIADGVHSTLRQQLIPNSKPRYAGYTCWRATIDNSKLKIDKGIEVWGRKGRFGLTPLVKDRLYWYACINAEQNSKEKAAYSVRDLKNIFEDYPDEVQHVLAQTHDSDLILNDILDIKPLKRYAFGSVLLIGDAAHATTPNMGQGACQAIEDAAVMLSVLRKNSTISEAFTEFENRRLPRTGYIIRQSKRIGEIAQWEHPFAVFCRNSLMKILPYRWSQKPIAKLLNADFMKSN